MGVLERLAAAQGVPVRFPVEARGPLVRSPSGRGAAPEDGERPSRCAGRPGGYVRGGGETKL